MEKNNTKAQHNTYWTPLYNVHRNIFIVAKDQNPIKQRSTYLNKVDLF
jgi:hypothetical protein